MLTELARLVLLLAAAGQALAAGAPADDSVIQIRADFMQLDLHNGSSEYRGNVHIEKGGIRLSGERVTISRRDGRVGRITVSGSPARYTQQGKQNGGQTTRAQSREMQFDTASDILTLQSDARLEQGGQLIESPLIRFDTARQRLLAGSNEPAAGGKQRVNVIFGPDENDSGGSGQP